jgi:hypothetical protein
MDDDAGMPGSPIEDVGEVAFEQQSTAPREQQPAYPSAGTIVVKVRKLLHDDWMHPTGCAECTNLQVLLEFVLRAITMLMAQL